VDDLSELGVDMPLSRHVSLSPRVQYERFADHDNDVLTQTLLAQVGFRLAAIRNRLDADMNYTVNRNWTDDNSQDSTGYTYNATVAWTVLQPRTNRPGVAVFTTGSYLDDDNVYQIFAGLRIGWQAIY
jgi:hypothetical protein